MKKTKKPALKGLDLFEEDEQELDSGVAPEEKQRKTLPVFQSFKSKNGRIVIGTLSLLLVVGISSAVILQSKTKEVPPSSLSSSSQMASKRQKKEEAKKEEVKKEEGTKKTSEAKPPSETKSKAPVNKETPKEVPAPPVYRNIPPAEPVAETTSLGTLDTPSVQPSPEVKQDAESTQTLSSSPKKEGTLEAETVPLLVDMITIDLMPYIGKTIDGVPEDLSAQGATVIVEYKDDETHTPGTILEVFGQDTTARFIVAQ